MWWTAYSDFIAKGCQGMCLWDIFGNWKLETGKHGTFGEINDNGRHKKEGRKTGIRR